MINVIGLGYIGLPTALMLAQSGQRVTGTDYNESLINKLSNCELTFDEPGLSDTFNKAIERGITFSSSYITTNLYIVAVPTPYDDETKKVDMSYVVSAVSSVLDVCEEEVTIVIESTIPPGAIDKFIRPIVSQVKDKVIHLVHAPERIIPGNMIYELVNNSRTIGADDEVVANEIKEMYECFCRGEIVVTDIKSAEMTKVVENTFRDINIAFANELAQICFEAKMDVYEVIKIANMHPRVNILTPGPGVGGHCISVDPWFLVGDYPNITKLIRTARETNDSMPEFVLERLKDIMKENDISDFKRVGFYGLTYKEDVDDTRESPTLQLLNKMEPEAREVVKVFDPFVNERLAQSQMSSFSDFINTVDLVVVLVAHSELEQKASMFSDKIVFDTKNVSYLKANYKL